MAIGRPTDYTPEIGAKICHAVISGQTLNAFCKLPENPPAGTVYQWLTVHAAFAEMYAQARQRLVDHWADEIIEIADSPVSDMASVTHAKLRVDTRKWLMTKIDPRKWGDKLELGGNIGLSALIEAVHAKLPAPDGDAAGEAIDGDCEDISQKTADPNQDVVLQPDATEPKSAK